MVLSNYPVSRVPAIEPQIMTAFLSADACCPCLPCIVILFEPVPHDTLSLQVWQSVHQAQAMWPLWSCVPCRPVTISYDDN